MAFLRPSIYFQDDNEHQLSGRPSRADKNELYEIFSMYASQVGKDGKLFMTGRDFFAKFVGMTIADDADTETLKMLTGIIDMSGNNLISFDEFYTFEGLLTHPDAIYRIAFRLFDSDGSGYISFDEFQNVYSKTLVHQRVPFNFNCNFVKMHFGKKRTKVLSFTEFTEFLQSVQEEHARQAFNALESEETGCITPEQLKEIMTTIRTHLLTTHVADNLIAATGGKQVSFAFFDALNHLLSSMDVVRRIFQESIEGSNVNSMSKEQFIKSAQAYLQITPLEIDILFQLAHLKHSEGYINKEDLDNIAPRENDVQLFEHEEQVFEEKESRGILIQAAESVYRFSLGSIAGAIGATAVYPIDLVKTRMQNQRKLVMSEEVMYRHSVDCFRKVIRFEGFRGLYRGLPPQLLGVAPEKAIKLTVNDFIRDKVIRPDGSIPLWGEILAGGTAGACQVIFTNPLEIVKIRLQVAGEIASARRISAFSVVRELGITRIYKGASACLLRDISFAAIYFPAYAHLKIAFQDDNGRNSPASLFAAGICAGVPAPFFTTPADVIKTRLQVKARLGQTTYSGIFDCANKIMQEEGWTAFWKGSLARVFRSAPQFAVTLLSYELLQRILPIDFGGNRPVGSVNKTKIPELVTELPPTNPHHIGGLRLSAAAFAGIESKFGLFLPKFINPLHSKILENQITS